MKNIKDYIGKKYAIVCITEKESFEINQLIKGNGGRNLHHQWNKEKDGYIKNYGGLEYGLDVPYNSFCYKGYYENDGYTILEAKDFLEDNNNSLSINDLKEGKIYYVESKKSNSKFIAKFNGKDEHCHAIRYNVNEDFSSGYILFMDDNLDKYPVLRLANEEEIHWFNVCFEKNKYISKEEALKTFNAVPKYIECIKDLDSFTIKGRIFKTGGDFRWSIQEFGSKNLDWDSWCFKWNDSNTKEYFQPSTEAAYLSQFNKQEENDFNVGDWVVCIALNKISDDSSNYAKRVLKLDKCYKVSETLKSYSSTKSQVIRVEKTDYLHLSSNFRHAKLEEISTEQLSDEEILQLARKHYPPSSVVYPIYGDKKQNRKIIGSYYKIGYANSNNSKTIITDYKDDDGKFEDIAIWSNKNGWAKIVSKPSVAELIKPHQEAITNSWNTINSNFNQECIIYDGGNGVFQWEIDTINYGQLESDTIIIKNRNKSVDLQITKRPKIQFQQENLIKL